MEEKTKQQANQIAEIINSVKNCRYCPIYNTCNEYEYLYGNNLCKSFKDIDNLNITD